MQNVAEVQTLSPKREKFIRLAQRRTTNAIKYIQLIGNLSNRTAYEYGDLDVKKIADALQDAIEEFKTRMSGPEKKSRASFKL